MRARATVEDRLAEIPLFAGLNRRELKRLGSLTTTLDVPAGEVLTREGESGREFLVVREGELEVRRDDRLVATLGPGSYVGEIALVSSQPRTATVIATTPAKLEIMERREFQELLRELPQLAVPIMATVAARLDELEGQTRR